VDDGPDEVGVDAEERGSPQVGIEVVDLRPRPGEVARVRGDAGPQVADGAPDVEADGAARRRLEGAVDDCLGSSSMNSFQCDAAGIGSCTPPASDCTMGQMACNVDSDCPGLGTCNSVTRHCFDGSQSCTGTPCAEDHDCSQLQACNSATGLCN
jgi:hypothetical protein